MESQDLDNFFKDKLNSLDGLPPNVNFDMEQTFGKLEARMNKKVWRPKLFDIAASVVLLIASSFFVTSELEERFSTEKKDNILSEQIFKEKTLFKTDESVSGKEGNNIASLVSKSIKKMPFSGNEKNMKASAVKMIAVENRSETEKAPQKISEMDFAFFDNQSSEIAALSLSNTEKTKISSLSENKKSLKIYYPFSQKNKEITASQDAVFTKNAANELNISLPAGIAFAKGNAGATVSALVSYKKQKTDSDQFSKYSLGVSSYIFASSNTETNQTIANNTFIEASFGKGKNNQKSTSLIDAIGVGYQLQGNSFGKRTIKLNVSKSFRNNKIHFTPEVLINEDFKKVSGGFRLTIGNV